MLKKENSLIRAALAAALILGAGLSAGQALANHDQPGIPERLIPDRDACKKTGKLGEGKSPHWTGKVDAACFIKYTEAWTNRSWDGCWIHNADGLWHEAADLVDHAPACRHIFGNPPNFPENPGDATHMIGCDVIGMVDSGDRLSCECPPARQVLRAEGGSGQERCVTAAEDGWADACRKNGWEISEVRNNDYRDDEARKALFVSAFFCDFPEPIFVGGAEHDGCVLYGPGDETARAGRPSCGGVNFDAPTAEAEVAAKAAEKAAARAAEEAAARAAEEAAARAAAEAAARAEAEAAARAEAARRRIPQGLPEEFEREFLDCEANHAIVMESNEDAADVACSVTTEDARTGKKYTDSCWIYKAPADAATEFGRTNSFPKCRDYYGNPTDFRNIPYVVGCETIGRAPAPDGQGCICPHSHPHARHDGRDGREWCLTNEEAESVEGCLDSGGELVEVVSNAGAYVEGSAYGADPGFFCDFPVPVFTGGAYGKKARAGCFLYGLGGETARASDLPCSDFDFAALADNAFALSDEERERAPKGLPSDRVKEYISCDDHHAVVEESRLFVDKVHGTDEVWRPTDAVCAVKIADARTGGYWNACWIYNEPELKDHYKFTAYNIHPDCREIFGDPADFSTMARDSVRVVGCEAIGRAASRAGDRCICPSETPRERFDGRTGAQICVDDAANDLANACAENGWTIAEVLAGNTHADSLNAFFFCQIPVHNYGGESYDGCGLYGPAAAEDGRPSCAEVDVFAGRDAPYAYDCGAEKAYLDGACACPPERPELFAYRGGELCLGEDVKFMADLCKGNGWRVQNIGGGVPPQLACVMTREQR